jgi:hypothetical protein
MTYEDYYYLRQKKEMMLHIRWALSESEIKMNRNIDEQNISSWQKNSN